MNKLISFIIGIIVFVSWMNIVGNPSETETIIGLCIAVVSGLWVCDKFGCFNF